MKQELMSFLSMPDEVPKSHEGQQVAGFVEPFDAVLVATNTALLDVHVTKKNAVGLKDFTKLVQFLRSHPATQHAQVSILTPLVYVGEET